MSDVGLNAKTCHACGAIWGFSNGMSRYELYQDAKTDIQLGLLYLVVMVILILLGSLGVTEFFLLALFGLLFAIKYLVKHLVTGIVNLQRAKKFNEGDITWWRVP